LRAAAFIVVGCQSLDDQTGRMFVIGFVLVAGGSLGWGLAHGLRAPRAARAAGAGS
jgi:hypothetical protein